MHGNQLHIDGRSGDGSGDEGGSSSEQTSEGGDNEGESESRIRDVESFDIDIEVFHRDDLPDDVVMIEEKNDGPAVILNDGDTINLVDDLDQVTYERYNQFVSQQLFIKELEGGEELLKTEAERRSSQEQWFKDEIGGDRFKMPIWGLIMVAFIAVFITVLSFFICLQLKKNKQEQQLQERALEHELSLAQQEGVEIPIALQKRLSRLNSRLGRSAAGSDYVKDGKEGKEGTSAKVAPEVSGPDAPNRRGMRNLTRYAANSA